MIAGTSYVTTVTSRSEFDKAISQTGKVVIVDFTATWCGPCQRISPLFQVIAERHTQKAIFLKIDVDNFPELVEKFGVHAMPTFIAFKHGQKKDMFIGAQEDQLTDFIERLVVQDS